MTTTRRARLDPQVRLVLNDLVDGLTNAQLFVIASSEKRAAEWVRVKFIEKGIPLPAGQDTEAAAYLCGEAE